jgi:hypothetical protein
MTRNARLLTALASLWAFPSIGRFSGVTSARLEQRPAVLADSVQWDTAAWHRVGRAKTIPMRPLTHDAQIRAFLEIVPGFKRKARAVVSDQVTWDSVWANMTLHGRAARPGYFGPPKIDFARDRLLIVTNGDIHAGSDITIARVAQRHDTLFAFVLFEIDVHRDCHSDFEENHIATAVIPRSGSPVVFVEGSRRAKCPF